MNDTNIDYEWDMKNNIKINHKNKTIEWLFTSKTKLSLFDKIQSNIGYISNISVRNIILILMVPILLSSFSIGKSTDSNNIESDSDKQCADVVVVIPSYNFLSNIIHKYPNVDSEKIKLSKKYEKDLISKINNSKSFDDFAKDIAQRESSGRWKVSNKYGYMGLYQIGRLALKDVSQRTDDPELKGLHRIINKNTFDEDPNIFPKELQKKVFKQLVKNNKYYLRNYYSYIGQEVGGIEITESGILGSAHLVGQNGIKKFLKSNGEIDITDKNGVKCSEYLKLFSHYKIDLI